MDTCFGGSTDEATMGLGGAPGGGWVCMETIGAWIRHLSSARLARNSFQGADVAQTGDEGWIPIEDDRAWTGELAELRPAVVDPTYDRVDNIMAVHGLDPGSLKSHLQLYRQAMKGTATLRKVDREMIALTVSTINECHY
jgi:hypothetical protein